LKSVGIAFRLNHQITVNATHILFYHNLRFNLFLGFKYDIRMPPRRFKMAHPISQDPCRHSRKHTFQEPVNLLKLCNDGIVLRASLFKSGRSLSADDNGLARPGPPPPLVAPPPQGEGVPAASGTSRLSLALDLKARPGWGAIRRRPPVYSWKLVTLRLEERRYAGIWMMTVCE
jgi:hypothetical protein